MGSIIFDTNYCEVGEIIESLGYLHAEYWDNEVNGIFFKHYLKDIPTGRIHICVESVNALCTAVNVHFDKYKGNRDKPSHHVSRYRHPYALEAERELIECFKKKNIRL